VEAWLRFARAPVFQTVLTWAALIATYIATDPGQNINWVFGPGSKPQQMLPPLAYLALEMTMLPVIVILPMHFLLKHLFAPT